MKKLLLNKLLAVFILLGVGSGISTPAIGGCGLCTVNYMYPIKKCKNVECKEAKSVAEACMKSKVVAGWKADIGAFSSTFKSVDSSQTSAASSFEFYIPFALLKCS